MPNKRNINLKETYLLSSNAIITESTFVKGSGTIKNVRFIAAGWSKNDRYYSKEALATLLPLLKEAKVMFLNHRDATQGRDLGQWVSKITRIEQLDNGDLVGDIKMTKNSQHHWLFEQAQEDSDVLGLSIYAYATAHKGEAEGKTGDIIDKFVAVESCDWVYRPGAKGGFNKMATETFDLSSEFCLAYESEDYRKVIEVLSNNSLETIKENFFDEYSLRNLLNLCSWLNEYLFWNILITDMTEDAKKQAITSTLDIFKEIYIDLVNSSGILAKSGWDVMDTYSDLYETPDDTTDEGYDSGSDTDKKKKKKKGMMENFDKYPDLQKYNYLLEKLTINKENEMILTMEQLKKDSPEFAKIVMAEAVSIANEAYQEERKSWGTEKKTLETDLTSVKTKVEDLTKSVESLTTQVKDKDATIEGLNKKIKEFEDAEKTLKLEKSKETRKTMLAKILSDEKVAESDVPAKLYAKFLDTEAFTDVEASEGLKEILDVRSKVTHKGATPPKKEKEDVDVSKENSSATELGSKAFSN